MNNNKKIYFVSCNKDSKFTNFPDSYFLGPFLSESDAVSMSKDILNKKVIQDIYLFYKDQDITKKEVEESFSYEVFSVEEPGLLLCYTNYM